MPIVVVDVGRFNELADELVGVRPGTTAKREAERFLSKPTLSKALLEIDAKMKRIKRRNKRTATLAKSVPDVETRRREFDRLHEKSLSLAASGEITGAQGYQLDMHMAALAKAWGL